MTARRQLEGSGDCSSEGICIRVTSSAPSLLSRAFLRSAARCGAVWAGHLSARERGSLCVALSLRSLARLAGMEAMSLALVALCSPDGAQGTHFGLRVCLKGFCQQFTVLQLIFFPLPFFVSLSLCVLTQSCHCRLLERETALGIWRMCG